MAGRADLLDWVTDALSALGGKARIVDVARHIWINHEADLKSSKNLFYTWQYDMRWAALKLRKDGKLMPADKAPRGVWMLK